jgi:hypothetical protein
MTQLHNQYIGFSFMQVATSLQKMCVVWCGGEKAAGYF